MFRRLTSREILHRRIKELLKISDLFTLIINGAFESLLSRATCKVRDLKRWKNTSSFFCFIPIITGQLSVIFLLLMDLIKHRLKLSSFLPWFSFHETTQLSTFDSSMPLFWHRKDSLWILVRTIAHRKAQNTFFVSQQKYTESEMQSYIYCAQSVIIFHYVNPEKARGPDTYY